MRKMLLWAGLLVLSCVPPVQATHYRETFGTIVAPVVIGPVGLSTQLGICAAERAGPEDLGLVVWIVELAPEEGDGKHLFVLKDAQMGMTPPPTNFDITFFSDLGCDPVALRAPAQVGPAFARAGDESGSIPAGARHAIVTTTDGAMVAFELRIAG